MKNQFRIISIEKPSPSTIKAVLQDEEDKIYILHGVEDKSSIPKNYASKCMKCGRPIDSKYTLCFDCNEEKRLNFA